MVRKRAQKYRFNITEYRIDERDRKVETSEKNIPFETLCRMYREKQEEEFDRIQREKPSESDEWLNRQHFAIVGKPEVVTSSIDRIQSFLTSINVSNAELPEYYQKLNRYCIPEQRGYSNLAHAIFHEVYGFGALAAWSIYPDSYSAQIIGTRIFFHKDGKHELMPYEFKDLEEVYQLIRNLTRQKPDAKVNEFNTKLEVDLYTGERVTLMVPPSVKHPVITFRRFLISSIVIEDLAHEKKKTIAKESVPLFKGISKTMCNVVVAGVLGTGKTTDIKALIAERDEGLTGVVMEKHYELAVSRDFPRKKILEIIVNESEFNVAFDSVLRSDADYVIIGETRRVEVEGAMLACERLNKGMITTYHTTQPDRIPSQWARLICQLNKTHDVEEQQKRVAENIDFVIVKTQDETRKKKRVKSITELRYDRQTGEISAHDIMLWDAKTDSWTYRFDVSESLLNEMRSIEPYWANQFEKTLKTLADKFPMPDHLGVTVFNPIQQRADYRTANALEAIANSLVKMEERVTQLESQAKKKGGGTS